VTLSTVHRHHLATLRSLPAVVDVEGLRLGDRYVMFFAEAALMGRHAAVLLEGVTRADVLDVGLGLGVFAEQAAHMGIGSYTAVEPHPVVAKLVAERVLTSLSCRVTVIPQPWQLASLPPSAYDAIMLDTWPPDGHADDDFAAFVAQVAIPSLRPGGRFSFFHSGNELAPARAAVLDRLFVRWHTDRYTMPAAQTPPHWTKPTRNFLVPIAYKAGG
jgi:spermidine synthase